MKRIMTRPGVDKVKPKVWLRYSLVVGGVVAPMILVSALVPLVLIWVLNSVGLGWGWA